MWTDTLAKPPLLAGLRALTAAVTPALTVAMAFAMAFALAGRARAQAGDDAPLSVIDWLGRGESVAAVGPRDDATGAGRSLAAPDEPPVSDGATVPEVTVTPLDEVDDAATGLLPVSVTGLPADLWLGSEPRRLARMIRDLQVDDLPAMQSLLFTLLLAEAVAPPSGRQRPDLLLARVDKLVDLGAVEPALALLDRVGPDRHAALFKRYFDLSLLNGTEDDACARMAERPDLAPGYAARTYCLARSGDWAGAMLTFQTARALGEISATDTALLELFLEPELIETAPAPAPPPEITPLAFRLFEAIGQPLTATGLPRAYAMADLRDVSGWKAELEAVERLVRTGALSENRLIGAYSEREPAASGGIWDRVEAAQAFDAAMESGAAEGIARTLPPVWEAMQSVRLEVPFARLYGERLAALDLPAGPARRLAFRVAMLSPAYESAAGQMTVTGREDRFLASVARGEADAADATSATSRAVATAFDPAATPPPGTVSLVREGRLGEAILATMDTLSHAAEGEAKDATRALIALRALGLEDTARSAALQMLILDRRFR